MTNPTPITATSEPNINFQLAFMLFTKAKPKITVTSGAVHTKKLTFVTSDKPTAYFSAKKEIYPPVLPSQTIFNSSCHEFPHSVLGDIVHIQR